MNNLLPDAAVFLGWLLLFLGVLLVLAYRRASLAVSTCALGALLVVYWAFGGAPAWWKMILCVPFAALLLLNV
ncbi:MAG TPA: hypothetical protein VIJ37_05805, partial [Steroidobacteraceae bacterium]